MKLLILTTAVVLATAASVAGADQPIETARDIQDVTSWFAGRLVGTYQTEAQVRKCGTDLPFQTVTNTLSVHSHGTVTESPRAPPTGGFGWYGIPGQVTRTIGLGSWWYSLGARRYGMTLRYDFFVDGVFYGTGTVDRDIQLSNHGDTASGPVQVAILAADGSVILELCGDATSTRL